MTTGHEVGGPAPKRRLLTLREVMDVTGLSRGTIYDLIEKGLFPRPVRAGPRAARWLNDELDAWIEELPRATLQNLH